jgi:hypothetical protein
MAYQCKIIADSVCNGHRITSFLLTYPRIIHAELMTHRMFSRNSASSRAIPFEKMVKMVEEDPFIPIAWQKDHKGMQGSEYLDSKVPSCQGEWLRARSQAVRFARELNESHGVTKQLCNRLLEPFMWHTVLVTATEYDNFFDLRCPKYYFEPSGKYFNSRRDFLEEWNNTFKVGIDVSKAMDLESLTIGSEFNKSQAEIHIQTLAELMWDALHDSIPKELKEGEWHIPFGDRIGDIPERIWEMCGYNEDNPLFADATSLQLAQIYEEIKTKIAVARCARLSYMTFDGVIDYEKDIKLYNQLFKSKHFSPFEHCARAMSEEEYYTFIKGKSNANWDTDLVTDNTYEISAQFDHNVLGWCNNFRGFIPYRYLIESSITK